MLSVFFHALELPADHLIISVVDRVSRLPRNSTPPEMMQRYEVDLLWAGP